MKNSFVLAILLFAILAFGCISLGGSGTSNNSTILGPSAPPSGSSSTPGGSVSGGSTSSGSTSTIVGGSRSPREVADTCFTDCEIATGGPRAVCQAGCTMDWAKEAKDMEVCRGIFSLHDLGDMTNNYYYGCLDVVAGATNSTTPCGSIPDINRRNACFEAAAADAHNPSLCNAITIPDHPSDLDAAYRQSYQNITGDCMASAIQTG